jgi:hypothetical protein
MRSGRRARVAALAIVLAGILGVAAQPSPPKAEANVGCDVVAGGLGVPSNVAKAITGGAIGGGNPVGDLCDKVSGAVGSPVKSALDSVGDDVFKEMTKWVAEGDAWLMDQAVKAIDSSTTPHLRRAGFLSEYAKMSAIAVLLAVAALLAAILQGIAQGNAGLMVRAVFVNAPMAFIGTSAAFVVVQMLVGITDSLCHAISAGSGGQGVQFFEAAISDIGKIWGGNIGAIYGAQAGALHTPLFVGFLLAVIGAVAGFCVLVEFALRDAAIYAVSLFMPFALYASIAPSWRNTLRKYAEVLLSVIGSKFVIVAILALAATLISKEEETVEVILVATVLMGLACFSPFFLFRIVAFSEGAITASVARRSGPGMVGGGVSRTAYNARMLTAMARSGGGGAKGGSGVKLWSATDLAKNTPAGGPSGTPAGSPGAGGGKGSGGGSADRPASPGSTSEGPPRPTTGSPGTASGGPTAGASKAASGAGAAGAGPAGAALGAAKEAAALPKKGAEHLSGTATARSAGEAGDGGGSPVSSPGGATERSPRPDAGPDRKGGDGGGGGTPPTGPGERPPRPPSQSPRRPRGTDGGEAS